MSELPPGVTRCKECNQKATLDTCHALMFSHVHEGSDQVFEIVAWRGEPVNIRPVDAGKRLRDLRPGDAVIVFEKPATLVGVEIYR